MKCQKCKKEELAKAMVKAGILRGVISCDKHGFHNVYSIYKKQLNIKSN